MHAPLYPRAGQNPIPRFRETTPGWPWTFGSGGHLNCPEVEIRTATEADAESVGAMLGLPEAATNRLLRTRTVQVAVVEEELVSCLSYEVYDGAVEVTRLGGDPATLPDLLDAPRRLATSEGLPVRVLVPDGDTDTAEMVAANGFQRVGSGPRFADRGTTRYRWEPTADS